MGKTMAKSMKVITLMVAVVLTALGSGLPAWAESGDRTAVRVNRVVEPSSGREVALYEESHALIIGNSVYRNGLRSLPGVRVDEVEVKRALELHGFTVDLVQDQDTYGMRRALDDFIAHYGH